MKIIEITNVDFSLRHFLLPLMRGIRARGHEVIGVCADGPLLDERARARGSAWLAVPFAAAAVAAGACRAHFAPWCGCCARERPDLVHAHMPISGFLARLAARVAGVPRVAYTCHGFLFNQHGVLAAPRRWLGRWNGSAAVSPTCS